MDSTAIINCIGTRLFRHLRTPWLPGAFVILAHVQQRNEHGPAKSSFETSGMTLNLFIVVLSNPKSFVNEGAHPTTFVGYSSQG